MHTTFASSIRGFSRFLPAAGRRGGASPARALKLGIMAILAGIAAGVPGAAHAQTLDCARAAKVVSVLLKSHFSIQTFDDELSQRMFDQYLKILDPGKVYFTAADFKELKDKYEKSFDDYIGKENCEPVSEIMKRFNRRFDETLPVIAKMIDMDHDFKVDEYMVVDRKEIDWAGTADEISDRWRKRIKYQVLQQRNAKEDIKKIREKLHKRFQLQAKRNNERTTSDMYGIFLDAAAVSLDPHSDYFTEDEIEEFRINNRLSLEGIGAVLGSEDGFTTIQSLVPGGAAARTGKLKEKDKIIAVAQGSGPMVNVFDMDLREVVRFIRGPRGSEVRLQIRREEESGVTNFEVPVIREQIQLEERAARSFVYDLKAKDREGKEKSYKVGLIDLPSFYFDFQGRQNKKTDFRSSSEDVKKQIESLKKRKVDAIAIDLRSNGGGALEESIKIAGFFIESGPVVQVKGLEGEPYVYSDEDPELLYDGPLIVMINRNSASASEIFAGAIKDYNRGLIVGDSHTFGKGTVQNVSEIPGLPGSIKITIQKFYRPLGASTQLEGVPSDIVLPSIFDELEIGEKYYDYALDFSRVGAAEVKDYKETGSLVEGIRKASEARVGKNPLFGEVKDAIDKYRAGKAERSRISLREGADKPEDEAGIDEDEEASSSRSKDAEVQRIDLINKDAYVQEAMMIAGDYVNALAKSPLPASYRLPDVKEDNKVASKEAGGKAETANDGKAADKAGNPKKSGDGDKGPDVKSTEKKKEGPKHID